MSYDLREPLRYLDGFPELIQKMIEETLEEQSRHGGRTWAEMKVTQGAAFYLSLPKPIQRGE